MFKNKSKENIQKSQPKAIAFAEYTKAKAKSVFDFLVNNFDVVKKELELIKEKSKNLLEANYQLGLRHLEKGNLSDAIFRFRIIKKFWPNHYDAYLQLANCYILTKKYYRAKAVIADLIKLNPTYENKAQELLNKIQELQSNSNI
jgi:outer membrane protein assembly factor BamD (BamD/ComL family)